MRIELELIERIENYLMGTMSSEEQLVFVTEMNSDESLKTNVELQEGLMRAVQSIGLKVSAKNAHWAWRVRKWLKRILFMFIILGGTMTTIYCWPGENEPDCECKESTFQKSDNEDSVMETDCCENKTEENTVIDSGSPDTLFYDVNNTDSIMEENIYQDDIDELHDANFNIVVNDELEYENFPEIQPSYRGGESALNKYLQKNIEYPQKAIDQNIEGTVYVRFMIFSNGKIGKVSIAKGVDDLLDKEALRVVKGMPDWIPAKHRGEFVELQYTLPIVFRLE